MSGLVFPYNPRQTQNPVKPSRPFSYAPYHPAFPRNLIGVEAVAKLIVIDEQQFFGSGYYWDSPWGLFTGFLPGPDGSSRLYTTATYTYVRGSQDNETGVVFTHRYDPNIDSEYSGGGSHTEDFDSNHTITRSFSIDENGRVKVHISYEGDPPIAEDDIEFGLGGAVGGAVSETEARSGGGDYRFKIELSNVADMEAITNNWLDSMERGVIEA